MADTPTQETSTQELVADLRATRARLDAAHEDIAALKVLLTLRTHQHDLAAQAAQRLEAERAAARAAGKPAPAREDAVSAEALACAQERFEASKVVLGAVLACLGWRGLDRRRFKALIAEAGRDTPESGPASARHAVLLGEARRVLGGLG